MALNNSQQDIIDRRRELVASMRLRGLTQRQIVVALSSPDKGFRNPETGEPWSLGTVNADIKALNARWKRSAQKKTIAYKSKALAELEELKLAAWNAKNLELVRRCISDIRAMMGTDSPSKAEVTGADGGPIQQEVTHRFTDMSDGELERLLQ